MSFTANAEHRRVLAILACYPDGATAYCLTQFNRVALATINDLLQHELIDARSTQVAAPGSAGRTSTVIRLHIISAGRWALGR